MTSAQVKKALAALADPERATSSLRFFKTGKGQYGEGDRFIGVTVPQIRAVARQFVGMSLSETTKLLQSPIHEHRMTALVMMVELYRVSKNDSKVQKLVVDSYLINLKFVDNWDLVDSSASQIFGNWLLTRDRSILYKQVVSPRLWTRRVAMIATHAMVRQGQAEDALALAKLLLDDEEDLMHKAVGWTLREVGKRCSREELRGFLKEHAAQMPRTMLRYSIEHLDERERKRWMSA